MIGQEDLFNIAMQKVNTLVIRYGGKTKQWFDESNKLVPFDKIVETLSQGEWECSLSKRNESEIQISVPFFEPQGQVDLVVEYNPVNYTFELKVQYNQKTRFKLFRSEPNPEFSFKMKARFAFLDPTSNWPNLNDLMEMSKIKDRALSLDISPEKSVEDQEDIWDEYINAQAQLIERLRQPYSCIDGPNVSEEKSRSGEGVYRYKVEFRLQPQNRGEYDDLVNALKEDLNIDAEFDSEGVAFMKYDDIKRGLDPVIRRRFPDRYECDQKIGCIVSLRPYTNAERIEEGKSHLGSFDQKGTFIQVSDINAPISQIVEEMGALGYNPSIVTTEYSINGVDNLYQSEHVEKYGITFGNKYTKKTGEREMLLPEPVEGGRVFRLDRKWNENFEVDQRFFYNALCHIYGKENVVQRFLFKFKPVEYEEYVPGFSDEQWTDIKKDFYGFGWEYSAGSSEDGMNLYFDFEDREELEKKVADILSIKGKYVMRKSPLDEDFGFKVTTHLTARKTAQQIFRENLEKLNGADFVYAYREELEEGEKPKRPVFIPVGKLNSYESSMDKLVLYLNNVFAEDKKAAELFLKFYQKHPRFNAIQANLVGDNAKVSWLRDAMNKLRTSGSMEPNSHAVNEKIKDFIFDSSKAEPVFRFEETSITDTEEYRNFDRTAVLSLNPSQKEAVLKGVASRDLCMLQGPPGTGKTTVIAELIWQHIRENQGSKLLLTSETNLAVDNALEKLMNGKASNPDMARYLTLIKPLRFGRSTKFEEEGKRYSMERIEKWIDNNAQVNDEYENEVLSEEASASEKEEVEEGDVRDNVIQSWMSAIADRSALSGDRYSEVLRDWQIGLAQPDVLTKEYFRDLYYKHVNVVGSTCSSTGSPAFMAEYLKTFRRMSTEVIAGVKKGLYNLKKFENKDRSIYQLANILGIETSTLVETRNAVNNACNITFDTVIMDEASKATPPELLMPLCFGHKSIVIGDHRQLPPMLNEKSFREALLDLESEKATALAEEIDRNFVETSQFKRMILNPKVSKTIKATFNTQYRMHPQINDVIKQFYVSDECGGLSCGLDRDKVNSPDLSEPQSRYHGFNKPGFINPNVHTIWVNVDAPEASDGSSKVNATEIDAINKVLELLKTSEGFDKYMQHWDSLKSESKRKEEKEIGVISFYGKQVRKIRESVRPQARKLGVQIKMNTVDKFQGMERNIVIVSTVRSNKSDKGNGRIESNTDAGFAKSPERLNVALSRARRLLIVVGNKDFFSQIRDKEGNYLYRNAIAEIERSGLVINYKDLK